jgi:hypothetical protein
MIKKLTITIYKDDKGFRSVASGTRHFNDNWKEFGNTFEESLGMQIRSLYDQGFLDEPFSLQIVDWSDVQWQDA